MSRPAMTKSRAEKIRTSIPTPLPAPTAPQIVDIVPGRFSEADWISMVAVEEGEEIVGETVDELINLVMKQCFQVYLQRQRIPYTISQAKDATIQIIEWRFLIRDTGEACVAKDTTWQEEKEPVSCLIDSWAQGTVPVIHTGFTPHEDDERVTLEEHSWMSIVSSPIIQTDDELSVPQPLSISLAPEIEEHISEEMSKMENVKVEKDKKFRSPSIPQELVPPSKEQKLKQEHKPHHGPLKSAGLKTITKPLETSEKEQLIQDLSQTLLKEESQEDLSNVKQSPTSLQTVSKVQLGKFSQRKEVIYDEFGNVISVPKLDPSRLPVPWIQPQTDILGSYIETERQRIDGIGALKLKSKKSITKTTGKEETVKDGSAFNLTTSSDALSKQMVKSKGTAPVTLKSGIPLESMQLSPGVVLKDGHSSGRSFLKSPKQGESYKKESGSDLKPIRSTIPCPSITVDQLLKDHTPRVQPITRFQTYPSSVRGHS